MIFGFGRKRQQEEEEEEIELVLFQGALNGNDANLSANGRLVEAGLVPAKELVTDALQRRAGAIRLEPKGDRAAAMLVIDGIAYPGDRYSRQQALAITQMLKLLAGLDIKERSKPQEGGIKAEFDGQPYELLVATTPLGGGAERLTVRANNLKVKLDTPADLGFSEELKNKVRELGVQKGIFCTVGPPASGTTTTEFAVIRALDAYIYQIFTLLDPGRRKLDNVTVFEVNPGDDLEKTLQRLFRIDADVILLEPLKDEATAKTIFAAHENAAMHTEFAAKDAAAGVVQLCKWVGNPKLVAAGLTAIMSQKLIRLLCSECRQAYRPNPQFLKKAGLPSSVTVLYRKPKLLEGEEPCGHCGGSGYYGRIAMFELLEMTEEMRSVVASGADGAAIKAQMRKEKMLTLQKDGLRLVAEGRTSLEELQRVFKAP